jgi:hypothetical protein
MAPKREAVCPKVVQILAGSREDAQTCPSSTTVQWERDLVLPDPFLYYLN